MVGLVGDQKIVGLTWFLHKKHKECAQCQNQRPPNGGFAEKGGPVRPWLHRSMTVNAWSMTIWEILFGQWPKF